MDTRSHPTPSNSNSRRLRKLPLGKLTVLKVVEVVDIGVSYQRAQQVGVSGCQRKGVYVWDRPQQWLMNAATQKHQ